LIWGSKDILIPIEHCAAFRSAIPGCLSVVVDDAGHAPFVEKPTLVAELIHKFIDMSYPQ
jgi:pimeloyl-ACP methyl ester carboxylesterase